MPTDSVSGESPLLGSKAAVFQLHVSLPSRRGEGALWGLFYKGTNPIYDDSALMT